MGIRFYDEALAKKVGDWMVDGNVAVLRPDETMRLFSMKADEAKDKPITLPLIAISRASRIGFPQVGKQPKTYDGFTLRLMDKDGSEVETNTSFHLNAIPITLQYQLDIYCRKFAEADEYLRNFVFNFINYPKLRVRFKYNGVNLVHDSSIYIVDDAADNSDIPERLFPDQFSRLTLTLGVDDAYLFSIPDKTNWSIAEVSLSMDGVEEVVVDDGKR